MHVPSHLAASQVVCFDDAPAPPGANPWVDGAGPDVGIDLAPPDPAWSQAYGRLEALIRTALGTTVLSLDHVGSTSVPGLAAKPILDLDLVIADPGDEPRYVPALQAVGFRLTVREPWWYGHRLLRGHAPRCNLHVFGPESPEPVRHRIFRDWLTATPADRSLYEDTKRAAAADANAAGENVVQYNERKQTVIREIYGRAFMAAGLLET